MTPVGVIIMKFAHAIARVLKGMEIWAEGGGDFWSGRCRPVCRLSSCCWEQAAENDVAGRFVLPFRSLMIE